MSQTAYTVLPDRGQSKDSSLLGTLELDVMFDIF